jgi:2-keto-4-pentenoate hydratase
MPPREEDAAARIWSLWQSGEVTPALPPDLRPATRTEGYAIQAHLERYTTRPLTGWKIAATSLAGQRHIGVDGPLAGRLLAETCFSPGATISIAHNRMRVAEPEFAFTMARDIIPRAQPYAQDEVMAAVADLHLTIELPDSRFADFASVGGPSLIADNACTRELVIGPRVTAPWRDLDLSRHTVKARVGRRYIRDGIGANVLGDPRIAMTWIANELSALGITLAKGQLVTTGTCMVPLDIAPGDHVHADFGALGTIEVQIAP